MGGVATTRKSFIALKDVKSIQLVADTSSTNAESWMVIHTHSGEKWKTRQTMDTNSDMLEGDFEKVSE